MKAVIYNKYGPPEVLRIAEVEKPAPKDNEVLVRVHATTVTIGDTIMRSFNMPIHGLQRLLAQLYLGMNAPKRPILGMELAGVVEAAGKKVTRFKPGDRVFGSTFSVNFGGYAEYKCLPENGVIAFMPETLSFGEAAALTGAGQTAWRCLEKGKIRRGQSVLIYGASGAVGTNAVQIAGRYYGAEVTAVCSTANLELVKSLGANKVIDYTKEDFTQSGMTYDVIFDAVGKLLPQKAKQALKHNGVYINVHKDSDGGEKQETLLRLKGLVEAGMLKPIIDRVYTMDQIVEAHSYVEAGHKKGNVVIAAMPLEKGNQII